MIIRYEMPRDWISYDRLAINDEWLEAKAAMPALTQMPYQRLKTHFISMSIPVLNVM
jgi:hypothetical protein